MAKIYKAINVKNGKHYIGFATNYDNRKSEHLSDSHNIKCSNYNSKFYNALRKYGKDAFEWEVLYEHWDRNYCLSVMEPLFIQIYDSYNNGYNMTLGGEGRIGAEPWNKGKKGNPWSSETREKMGKRIPWNKGKKGLQSGCGVKKGSVSSFKGKKHRPETIELIRQNSKGKSSRFKGKKHKPETIAKMKGKRK